MTLSIPVEGTGAHPVVVSQHPKGATKQSKRSFPDKKSSLRIQLSMINQK
jgi:hypothetical protein